MRKLFAAICLTVCERMQAMDDEKLRVFLWALGGAGFLFVLGGGFGAITGVVARKHGRAPGSIIGVTFARAVARASQQQLSDTMTGVLVGGCDGAVFLAVIGALVGTLAGLYSTMQASVVLYLCGGTTLLVVAALFFGLLAHGLLRSGIWCLGGICCAALLGAMVGNMLAGSDGVFYGIAGGVDWARRR